MAFDITIKEYLKEIDEAALLSWEEEKSLALRVIEDNDPQARDRLIRSNLRLVVNIAKKLTGPGMTLGDSIEEGNLGLMRAIDSFDPAHEVRFSTYAAWWIKQSIKKALLSNSQPIHVPTYMVELVNQYRHTIAELESQSGSAPELEEIAEAMKIPLRKAKAIHDLVNTVNSAFSPDGADNEATLDETIEDGKMDSPDEVLGTDEELAKAVRLLSEIEPREAEILTLRFGLNGQTPLTLKEIGGVLGLTRERVRQIQINALAQLNELMTV